VILYLTYKRRKWFAYSVKPIRWNSAADPDTALSGLIEGLRNIGCKALVLGVCRPSREFLEGEKNEN